MKKMIRFSFIAAIAAISLSSCKKDEETVIELTRLELINSGNWKIVSDQQKTGNGAWQERISGYVACYKDNYVKFNTNNTYEVNEGPTKCDAADPQFYAGPWNFEGESQINILGEVQSIDELSSSTLTLSTADTVSGTIYYYKQTYKH